MKALYLIGGTMGVGELQLKRIDREKKECTLSIHMQNTGLMQGDGKREYSGMG